MILALSVDRRGAVRAITGLTAASVRLPIAGGRRTFGLRAAAISLQGEAGGLCG